MLATCLAGSARAAGVERLYAVSFNGSLFPPGIGLVNDAGNVTGNVYLYQIDMASNKVLTALQLDEPAYFLAASPSGERLYLTDGRSMNVTVVDPVNLSITGLFTLNGSVAGIAMSPDGLQLYAILPGLRAIYALDAVNGTVRSIIPVNNTPFDLTIAPDGKWLYAVDSKNDSVAIIDAGVDRQSTIIHTGARPMGINAYPDGKTVYVANYGNNTVSVYDTGSFTLKTVILNVTKPSYVVADLQQSWVFATSFSEGNLTQVDVTDNTVAAVKPAGVSALGKPVVSADGVKIFVPDNGQKCIIIMSAATLFPEGVINFTDPVMAMALAAGAAEPDDAGTVPSPGPSGISTPTPGPSYYPDWGTPTPFYIPLPIPPKVSPVVLKRDTGIFGYTGWFPYITIQPVTQNDIIFILLIFIIVLIVLAGITYIMMFKKNDDDDDDD